MATSKYDLATMRKNINDKKGSFRDANEFVPPKAKPGQEINYRFYILPPLQAGDKTVDGKASRGMDVYFLQNGAHWINKKPFSCPRVHDGEECDLCTYGFDLMAEVQGDGQEAKKAKSAIARNYLPPQKNAVNIYFPKDPVNPEELWGRVMWFNASKTITNIGEACLMADDGGDELKPRAYGIFYDEENAYLFNLTIKEKGGFNDYESSMFLPTSKRPIVGTKQADGSILADPTKIELVLGKRHDLYTKFQPADGIKIAAILKSLIEKKSGGGGGDDAGFDNDDSAKPAPGSKKTTGAVVSETLDGEGSTQDAPPARMAPKATAPKTATPAAPAPKPVATKAVAPKATPPAPKAAEPIVEDAELPTTDEDADLENLMAELSQEPAE